VAHNAKWNGSSRLRFVLNGVRNCAPSSSRRPPRPPVNSTMLEQLVLNLDLTSPLDAAVAACTVTAFWGQCQIGELLPLLSSLTLSSPYRRAQTSRGPLGTRIRAFFAYLAPKLSIMAKTWSSSTNEILVIPSPFSKTISGSIMFATTNSCFP
jgi:hypothetical protein